MVGSTLGGKYVLVRLLGQGGMGSVYEARHARTGRRVAIKVIAENRREPRGLARLDVEARAAGAIESKHVVRIIDVSDGAADEPAYIVMEYLAGEDLGRLLDRLGPLPPLLALRIAAQACAGLERLHAEGVIHRDIKPANLFVAESEGRERLVKILDFGIAKVDSPASNRITQTGVAVGTPLYMSPEQARAEQAIDVRTDIWALGAVLYQSLSGTAPHETSLDRKALLQAICTTPAPRLEERAPWVGPEISALVARALAIGRERRFESAAAMRRAIEGLLPDSAIDAAMIVPLNPASPPPVPISNREVPSTATVSLSATGPARVEGLPLVLTSFVGRARELAKARDLLSRTRLLTLSGPGGTGKTRLAIRTAESLAPSMEHGVAFVDLSAVADASALDAALAAALGLREEPEQSLRAAVLYHLRSRALLLVLDNCEHLVTGCALLAEELLLKCPDLRLLATSREPLSIAAEVLLDIAPLPVPPQAASIGVDDLLRYEGVQLFVTRARAARHDFRLTASSAGDVAHICRKLDGLPLAVELAASRMRAMTAHQLAERLGDRFQALSDVRRTTARRQQTLRAMIDWSHDLLSDVEKAILRRVSVFQNGWTLAAAEAVCCWEEDPLEIMSDQVLELLFQLTSKSLIVLEEQEGAERYRLLETIRQYSGEKLRASGEAACVRERHLRTFIGLAAEADRALLTAEQFRWLSRLDVEHDNIRAALEYAAGAGRALEEALQLAGAMGRFWWLRGHLTEGRSRLADLLGRAKTQGASAGVRSKAGCQLALMQSDLDKALPSWRDALKAAREAGDAFCTAQCLVGLFEGALQGGAHEEGAALLEEALALANGTADPWIRARVLGELGRLRRHQLKLEESARLLEEALALAEGTGERALIALIQHTLGLTCSFQGNYEEGCRLTEASLDLLCALGFKTGMAEALSSLGGKLQCMGRYDEAEARYEETVALAEAVGSEELVAKAYLFLGDNALLRNDAGKARLYLREGFLRWQKVRRMDTLAWALFSMAELAIREQALDEAVVFFGAEQSLEETLMIGLHPLWRRKFEQLLAEVRARLGDASEPAWAKGSAMTLEGAAQAALVYLGGAFQVNPSRASISGLGGPVGNGGT